MTKRLPQPSNTETSSTILIGMTHFAIPITNWTTTHIHIAMARSVYLTAFPAHHSQQLQSNSLHCSSKSSSSFNTFHLHHHSTPRIISLWLAIYCIYSWVQSTVPWLKLFPYWYATQIDDEQRWKWSNALEFTISAPEHCYISLLLF